MPLLAAILLTWLVPVHAQEPTKVPRLGYLTTGSPSTNPERFEAFRHGLRELGYIEGKNIVIEWRYAEGKLDRQGELVRLKVDVIISAGPTVTQFAKEATSTIPIVMAFDNDPVGSGFVISLARPGGNITGLSALSPELSGKRLEILKEIVPRLSRVAVLGSSTTPGQTPTLRETELAAKAFGVQLQYLDVANPKELEPAFREASKRRADAILQLPNAVLNFQRPQIAELAVTSRLTCPWSGQRNSSSSLI